MSRKKNTTAAKSAVVENETPKNDEALDAADASAIAQLEANDAEPTETVQTEPAEASSVQEPQAALEPVENFRDVLKAITDEDADAMALKVAKAIDDRMEFEKAKSPDNSTIQKTLGKARAQIATRTAARVMIATNVSPEVFNRSIHTNVRYNVYAIGKVADVMAMLGSDEASPWVKNAINNAVIKSLFAFDKAGEVFNGEMARAACAKAIRVSNTKLSGLLTRHTVSSSTAPTQASSTMQALVTLGIVTAEGSVRNPTYRVRRTPAAERVRELVAA